MSKHAKLSASGSSRWLACPGSVNAEASYSNESSSFAEEGTLAHEIADQCLKSGHEAAEFIGSTVESLGVHFNTIAPDFEIEQYMTDYIQQYLDYVLSFETKDSELFTEQKVDYSDWVPGGFGTLDSSILVYSERILHIFDLKYGKGVIVDAFENTQGQTYALGMLAELGFLDAFDSIRIHIVQPRSTPKNFSHWDISVDDLEKFGDFVSERAALALTKDAPRVPGDKQCMWCKAKGNCPTLAKFTQDIIGAEFDDMDNNPECLPDTNSLTAQQVQAIMINKGLIEKFMGAVWAESLTKLNKGEHVPKFKLVESPANRKWGPDAEKTITRKVGKKQAYIQKFIGLGAAEKLLGKPYVHKLTTRPDPSIIMVHESDKRPAYIAQPIEDLFNDEDEL